MKYELMTWCGSESSADDGILKIARQTRIQPTIDNTVTFLAVLIETFGGESRYLSTGQHPRSTMPPRGISRPAKATSPR